MEGAVSRAAAIGVVCAAEAMSKDTPASAVAVVLRRIFLVAVTATARRAITPPVLPGTAVRD